jgi:hypothetical protein
MIRHMFRRVAGIFVFLLSAVAFSSAAQAVTSLVTFSSLPRGGTVTRAIPQHLRSNARKLMLAGNDFVWLVPTRNGNFCEGFSFGFGGCRGRVAPAWMNASERRAFQIGDTVIGRNSDAVAIGGDLLAPPGSSLTLVFGNGKRQQIPVTYVSAPINAGFYAISLPQRGPSHTPVRLIARSPSGETIASVKISS